MSDENVGASSGTPDRKKPPKPKEPWEPGWHWLLVLPILMIVKEINHRGSWGIFTAFLVAMGGVALASWATRLFYRADNQTRSSEQSAPEHPGPETAGNPQSCNPGMALTLPADERITAMPSSATPPGVGGEWQVIHGGKELGPFSLAELIGKVVVGELEAEDLVKKTGGLWHKAGEVELLQQQFFLRRSRGSTSQGPASQQGQKTVNRVASGVFTAAVLLFLLAHGSELVGRPSMFLVMCLGYGLFFVVPFLLARQRHYSGVLVASLFLVSGAFDIVVGAYCHSIANDVRQAHDDKRWSDSRPVIEARKPARADLNPANPPPAPPAPPIAVPTQATRTPHVDELTVDAADIHLPADPAPRRALPMLDKESPRPQTQVDEGSTDADTYFKRAHALYFQKDYDNAIKVLDKAIRLNTTDPRYYFTRGHSWYFKREYDKAIQDVDRAIQLAPHSALAYYVRGNALSGKKEQAKAIQDFDRSIQLDPKYADTYYSRGLAWCVMKKYDKAVKDFDQTIQLDGASEKIFPYYFRGFSWYCLADYDKAIRDYDMAIQLGMNNAEIHHNRGLVWYAKKDYTKAIEDIDQAIKLDPKNPGCYNFRGLAWRFKKEYDKAIQDFDQSIQLNQAFPEAYYNRGFVWSLKHEYDKAVKDLTQAIQLDKKHPHWFYERGIALGSKGDYDQAIDDFTQAIQLSPKYSAAFFYRGLSWSRKKDYDKAIQDYDEAINLRPKYVSAYVSRGVAWGAKEDYDKAIGDFDQAIRLDPANSSAYHNRGLAWSKKKDHEKASKDFDQANRLAKQKEEASGPALLSTEEEARLVRISNKLVAGMTQKEVAEMIGKAKSDKLEVYLPGDLIPDFQYVEKSRPLVMVCRYGAFEYKREPESKTVLFRLNLLFVNSRLEKWYVLPK